MQVNESNKYVLQNNDKYIIKVNFGNEEKISDIRVKVIDPEGIRWNKEVILWLNGKMLSETCSISKLKNICAFLRENKSGEDLRTQGYNFEVEQHDDKMLVYFTIESLKHGPNENSKESRRSGFFTQRDAQFFGLEAIALGAVLPFMAPALLAGGTAMGIAFGTGALVAGGAGLFKAGLTMFGYGYSTTQANFSPLECAEKTAKSFVIGTGGGAAGAATKVCPFLPNPPLVAASLSEAVGEATRQIVEKEKLNLKTIATAAVVGAVKHGSFQVMNFVTFEDLKYLEGAKMLPSFIPGPFYRMLIGMIPGGTSNGITQLFQNVLNSKPLMENVGKQVLSGTVQRACTVLLQEESWENQEDAFRSEIDRLSRQINSTFNRKFLRELEGLLEANLLAKNELMDEMDSWTLPPNFSNLAYSPPSVPSLKGKEKEEKEKESVPSLKGKEKEEKEKESVPSLKGKEKEVEKEKEKEVENEQEGNDSTFFLFPGRQDPTIIVEVEKRIELNEKKLEIVNKLRSADPASRKRLKGRKRRLEKRIEELQVLKAELIPFRKINSLF